MVQWRDWRDPYTLIDFHWWVETRHRRRHLRKLNDLSVEFEPISHIEHSVPTSRRRRKRGVDFTDWQTKRIFRKCDRKNNDEFFGGNGCDSGFDVWNLGDLLRHEKWNVVAENVFIRVEFVQKNFKLFVGQFLILEINIINDG